MVAIDFLPDVVFMDIGLPGISGYEAARQFRAAPQLQAAFLIALTGWGSAEDRRRSNEAGLDAHLTKPVEFAAIDTMLRQFRTNDNDRGVASQAP